MKKLTALVLVIVTLLSLVACGGSSLYSAAATQSNMEKKGYEVEVIADKEEILSELDDMTGMEFPVPTALITGEAGDKELSIMLFASEKDAVAFKKAYEDVLSKTIEQLVALLGEEAVKEMMGDSVALTADKNALYQSVTAAEAKAVLG